MDHDWLEDEKLEERLKEQTREELEKLRKRLFALCSNDKETEWWKDKLFRTMEIAIFQGIVFDYFTDDERKIIFEEIDKWRKRNGYNGKEINSNKKE